MVINQHYDSSAIPFRQPRQHLALRGLVDGEPHARRRRVEAQFSFTVTSEAGTKSPAR
jgi:hypothetical protein